MITKPDKVHKHKYKPTSDKKVLLSSGNKTAVDMLKQRKCECGKVETYDLERTIH